MHTPHGIDTRTLSQEPLVVGPFWRGNSSSSSTPLPLPVPAFPSVAPAPGASYQLVTSPAWLGLQVIGAACAWRQRALPGALMAALPRTPAPAPSSPCCADPGGHSPYPQGPTSPPPRPTGPCTPSPALFCLRGAPRLQNLSMLPQGATFFSDGGELSSRGAVVNLLGRCVTTCHSQRVKTRCALHVIQCKRPYASQSACM